MLWESDGWLATMPCSVQSHLTPLIAFEILEIETITCGCNLEQAAGHAVSDLHFTRHRAFSCRDQLKRSFLFHACVTVVVLR